MTGRPRMVAAALLGTLCVLGGLATTRALAGPAGLNPARPAGSEGVVGLPMGGAPAVTAVRRLLAPGSPAGDGAAVLVLPEDTHPLVSAYVRYQLAHVAYPRRVDVLGESEFARQGGIGDARGRRSPAYAAALAAPGLWLPAPWTPIASTGGFRLHVRHRP